MNLDVNFPFYSCVYLNEVVHNIDLIIKSFSHDFFQLQSNDKSFVLYYNKLNNFLKDLITILQNNEFNATFFTNRDLRFQFKNYIILKRIFSDKIFSVPYPHQSNNSISPNIIFCDKNNKIFHYYYFDVNECKKQFDILKEKYSFEFDFSKDT